MKGSLGTSIKRYQYTAIDDATRIRALQILSEHNQDCAIQFMDYVVETFPFRISTIRTDRGHEFQARFHWHVEDQEMQHVYIKSRVPTLLLWGVQDFVLSRRMARPSLDHCENGNLVYFPDATHWVQHEEAEGVNHHLIDFLLDRMSKQVPH